MTNATHMTNKQTKPDNMGLKALCKHIKAFRFQPNNSIRAIFKQAHTGAWIMDKKTATVAM